MHESGIAAMIVAALREHSSDGHGARVFVRGGHEDPIAFDLALQAHLAVADPQLDLSALEIIHQPRTLTCSNCGRTYRSPDATAPCPTCGGGAWPDHTPEVIELELLETAVAALPANGTGECV